MVTYYGFSLETKRCVFTASGAVEPQAGIIVIASEAAYEPEQIALGGDSTNWQLVLREATFAERVAALEAERSTRLLVAASKISALTDVVEFNTDPTYAESLLNWRRYRADVYVLDLSDPDNVSWPTVPAL